MLEALTVGHLVYIMFSFSGLFSAFTSVILVVKKKYFVIKNAAFLV